MEKETGCDESLSEARNPDIRNSLVALQRAARMAREVAVRTGTDIIISRDGEMVRVTSEELKQQGVR
jgi:hypothetical protein